MWVGRVLKIPCDESRCGVGGEAAVEVRRVLSTKSVDSCNVVLLSFSKQLDAQRPPRQWCVDSTLVRNTLRGMNLAEALKVYSLARNMPFLLINVVCGSLAPPPPSIS